MRGQTEAQESPGSQAGGQGTNILWADKIVSDYVFYALGVIRVPSHTTPEWAKYQKS